MKISDKKLKKAHALYEAGKYEEALKACEKVLKKEYHNEDALTIEGNSLYKLGRLEEAIINWKTNAEFNNNEQAKEFLSNINGEVKHKALNFDTIVGTKCDVAEIRAEIQRELAAAKHKEEDDLLKKLEKKALERKNEKTEKITEQTDTSNDPIIEVEKETNYDEIINNIEKEPLEEFKKEEEAHKKLSKIKADEILREIPKSYNKKRFKAPIIAACSVAIIAIGAYTFTHVNSPDKNNTQSSQEVTVPTHNQKLIDDLNLASTNKNYADLSAILSNTTKDKVAPEDLDAYNKAYDVMATDGVDTLYHEGLDKYKAKDYEGALTDFSAAYPYSKDNYLRPHILYLLGSTNEKLGDKSKEVDYFKMLLSEFPHSDMYTPEVLYTLANYYNENGDNEQAKHYAKDIENKYPSSIYYNDITKDIIYK